MKEVAGGLWLSALLVGAFLGIVPALIMFGIGTIPMVCELSRERQAEKRAADWRKNYPSYKY
jgi:hypothetical protein